jgi:hypothetical protein
LQTFICEGFSRLEFAPDCKAVRDAAAQESLQALDFFARVLGSCRFEFRFRFVPREQLESRPHHDSKRLVLVRTLMGPGTWVHPEGGKVFQVRPFDALILKGLTYAHRCAAEALLHGYPSADDPRATARGRVVMIAR